MASFPTSIVTPTDPTAGSLVTNPSHAGEHQSHNAEIIAVETKLGTGSSTATAGKVLRATGTGTSGWGQVDPTTDVATLSSATLRSLLTDETGTGVAVFGTTPTLTTPAITSPSITTAINDSNGNEVIKTPATASATNEVTITNAANGTSPSISATGSSDTNVDLKLIGKGTGKAYGDSIAEYAFDFIVSGMVWSGDSYGATLAASMTAGFAYISGVRVTVAAVTARVFTGTKDTYIDLSSAGAITYTEVTVNAASPALSANNIRIAIIQSGATITAVGAVNQGQETKLLPIASSIPYTVTDSLGNLICPRDPTRKLLGYRQIVSNATASTIAQIVGLTCPVIVPTARKIKVTFFCKDIFCSSLTTFSASIWDGVVNSGTQIGTVTINSTGTSTSLSIPATTEAITTPSATSKTYNAGLVASAGTATVEAATTAPAYIKVELA